MAGCTIAVLGLGEAGALIAADLVAAGATVRAYDPAEVPDVPGAERTGSEAAAVTGADLVLSVNSAHDATDALLNGAAGITPGTVWADLNTASPGLKRDLHRIAAAHGIEFADVALMSPVPGRGLRTPMLCSGPGAAGVAARLTPFGATVEVLAGAPGVAAGRKLLRSVFYKGMSAAVVEALAAARAAGCEDWLRGNISAELAAADASTLDRIVTGTEQHAVRRAAEMAAATAMVQELGLRPHVAAAARHLLDDLAAGRAGGADAGDGPVGSDKHDVNKL